MNKEIQIINQSETTTKKGDRWEATLLMNDRMFQGVITRNGVKLYESSLAYSEANVKRWLNTNIAAFNVQHEIKPPLPTVSYNAAKRRKAKAIEVETVEKPTALDEPPAPEETKEITLDVIAPPPIPEQPKPIAKRKPFTPYGLNGYLVDKNGNVRLMLDRKASAHTIVLNAEMFNALAEMVHKTQTQGEIT